MFTGRHRQHAAGEAAAQPAEHPVAQPLGHRRRAGHVEGQLDPAVGGVDALPAGPRGPGEAFAQLGRGHHESARHDQVVGHVGV